MGCDTSKSVHVQETHVRLERKPETARLTQYSDLQIDAIRSTWPLVNKDLTGNGVKLFLAIFEISPQLKEMFSFGDSDNKQLVENPLFKAHAHRFMLIIKAVVENVESSQADGTNNDVTKLVLTIGAKHATFSNFNTDYFGLFKNSMIYTWGTILGEEFTTDVCEAWSLLFDGIFETMEEGFRMFVAGKEKDGVGVETERSPYTARSLDTDRSVITQLLQNINKYIPDTESDKDADVGSSI